MLFFPFATTSQVSAPPPIKYALLVGIDRYNNPPGKPVGKPWRSGINDLEGCENDVNAMDDVLVRVYGLKDDGRQVIELKSHAATRQAILDQIDQLAEKANSGDGVFFFYSGHGSTVKNSATKKLLDTETPPVGISNTIVPADTMLGVPDISDKELANHFDKIVLKGVKLTAVFDSCYSGLIARGVDTVNYKAAQSPNLEVPSKDIKQPDPPFAPADRGALIVSAAKYYQPAGEVRSLSPPRGAFAFGLTETLLEDKGQSSFEEIFAEATAKCKLEVPTQEPAYQYEGPPERLKAGLFGEDVHGGKGMRLFVLKHPASATDHVTLQGGTESHVFKGTVLTAALNGGSATATVDDDGVGQSTASLTSGDPKVFMEAQTFTIHKPSEAQGLRLLIPRSSSTAAQLTSDGSAIAREVNNRFVGDPVTGTPTAELMQSGGHWLLYRLSTKPTPVEVSGVSKSLSPTDKLFVSLPLAADKAQGLKFGQASDDMIVEVSAMTDHPDYVLTGRLQNGKLYYLWVSPSAGKTKPAVKAGVGYRENTTGDSISFLPQETTPYSADDPNLQDELESDAQKLSNLKNWAATASDDQGDFPYHLEFVDLLTSQPVPNGGSVVAYKTLPTKDELSSKHTYRILLTKDENTRSVAPTPRFVYVMNIGPDFDGNEMGAPMSIAPRAGDQPIVVENRMGFLGSFGAERFVLITSQTPLPKGIFDFQGFVSWRSGGDETPLERLLRQNTSGKRNGGDIVVPTSWSLRRYVLESHLSP